MYMLKLSDMDSANDYLSKKSIPVCFSKYNLKVLEDYAKKKGMLDYSQAIEHLARKTWEK
jgi:hypothetical protein